MMSPMGMTPTHHRGKSMYATMNRTFHNTDKFDNDVVSDLRMQLMREKKDKMRLQREIKALRHKETMANRYKTSYN